MKQCSNKGFKIILAINYAVFSKCVWLAAEMFYKEGNRYIAYTCVLLQCSTEHCSL